MLFNQTKRPSTGAYGPVLPYTDDDTAFANQTLCPRYAESDPTSAPPSPASVESFDILDNVPWRRSYISLDSGHGRFQIQKRGTSRRRRSACIIAILLLFCMLLVAGCAFVVYLLLGAKTTS